jgi:cell division protein FtsI/penicillin-binding protein 2
MKTKTANPYSLIWGWIKNSVFLMSMIVIITCSITNAMLTYISIKSGEKLAKKEHAKYRRIVSQLVYEIVEIRDRWDYEISASADVKRAYIWQKIKKKNKIRYKKTMRYLKKKYPDLVGEYDEKWTY